MDLVDELFIDLGKFGVEGLDFLIKAGERFLVRKFLVEIGDGVKIDLLEF